MSAGTPLRLFQGFGIELEYMVVDAASLSIAPIADQILHEVTGEYSDYESEKTAWSNELVLHVIELGAVDVGKNYLMGVFPATVQTASDIAGRLVDMELYDLPETYFDHYRENIAAVTNEEIARVANKYLDPDRVLIVVVGNASHIREPLGTLGYPMDELDIDGNVLPVA